MDMALINMWVLNVKNNVISFIKNGAIGINDGNIIFIGETDELNYKKADILIDGDHHHVALPGLVNSHMHSSLTLCRGAVHDVPEIEYMMKGLRLFLKYMKPQDFILGTKLAVLEGLQSGTTTFVEYGLGVQSLVEKVYLPYRVSVVATELINEVNYAEEQNPNNLYHLHHYLGKSALKRANRLFQKTKSELVVPMYGPQALDMISIDLLKEIQRESVQRGSKMHMHIAQGERERRQIKKRFDSKTTVQVLKNHNLLGSELIAAHIHDTTENERKILIENNVSMVGCPSSISKIDGIIPPIADYLHLGGKVSIGTDEAPGTGHHNLFNEVRLASLLSKVNQKDPTVLPPSEAFNLVTIGAANILGLDNKIGALEVGKRADIITVDLNHLNLLPIIDFPFQNLLANIVYSIKGNEVDNVIIAGKQIIQDNKILDINIESVLKQVKKRSKEIFEDASEDWKKSESQMVEYHRKGFI